MGLRKASRSRSVALPTPSRGRPAAPPVQEWRDRITAHNDAYAAQALRVLAAAYRPLRDDEDHHTADADAIEQGLVFAGLLAMMDPPRPEVAHAVELCHRAQVRIIMITGDYGLTARSVATRLGIFSSDQGRVVTGVELGQMPEDSLLALLRSKDDVIFARVSPEDKLRLSRPQTWRGRRGDGAAGDRCSRPRARYRNRHGLSGPTWQRGSDMILPTTTAVDVNATRGRATRPTPKATYIFREQQPTFFCSLPQRRAHPLGLTILQILPGPGHRLGAALR